MAARDNLPVLDSVFNPELRPEGRLGLEEQAGDEAFLTGIM